MAKLRAPILFSQLSQDIYPIDGDCILSCKAKRKTKLITCTIEQVTGCWWKSQFLGNVWYVHGFRLAGITNFIQPYEIHHPSLWMEVHGRTCNMHCSLSNMFLEFSHFRKPWHGNLHRADVCVWICVDF